MAGLDRPSHRVIQSSFLAKLCPFPGQMCLKQKPIRRGVLSVEGSGELKQSGFVSPGREQTRYDRRKVGAGWRREESPKTSHTPPHNYCSQWLHGLINPVILESSLHFPSPPPSPSTSLNHPSCPQVLSVPFEATVNPGFSRCVHMVLFSGLSLCSFTPIRYPFLS